MRKMKVITDVHLLFSKVQVLNYYPNFDQVFRVTSYL